jgi:polyhydroxyalkanoate synthesis regulator phasin
MDKPKPDAYPDEARIIVDDVIRALSGGIGPRFDEMWERIGEWMREEVAFCAACHSDPIDALVKDRDDARRELAETKARLAALEEELAELKAREDTW